MTESTRDFLKLLFNDGETVCVSPYKYGYHSIEQIALDGDVHLISPNEEKPPITIKEKDINLIAINPIKGYRRDENVTAFRTFLIEMDSGSLEEQKTYIEGSGMPYSVCVFLGNKSLHYAIVLDEDLPSLSVWHWYNKWLLNVLSRADNQLVSPSRSIRFPNNKRRDGKKLTQSLVSLKKRISQEEFFKWLYQFEDKKPEIKKKIIKNDIYVGMPDVSKIPKDVMRILTDGITENRNATWFYVTCRIAKLGFEMQNVMNYLEQFFQEEKDFPRREWESCIKSAYKRVQGDIYIQEE